jgi:hypothetical protein
MSHSVDALAHLAESLVDLRLQIDAELRTLARAHRQAEQARLAESPADAGQWWQQIEEEIALLDSYQEDITATMHRMRLVARQHAAAAVAVEPPTPRVLPFVRPTRPAPSQVDWERQLA